MVKRVDLALAVKTADDYVAARDRAWTRAPVAGGGDPFFHHYDEAQRHVARLRELVGHRKAAQMIEESVRKSTDTIVFSPSPTRNTRR